MKKWCKWKNGLELKVLRVNIGKTKVMRFQVRIGRLRIQESIHVACAGWVLETIPLSALLATEGFVKGVHSGISGRLGYVADLRFRR